LTKNFTQNFEKHFETTETKSASS